MTMIQAHKVLIGTGVVFSAAPVVWGALRFARQGDTLALATAVGGAIAGIVLLLYYKRFAARHDGAAK